MIRPVLRYGDKMLHQESQELFADVSSVQELIEGMADTMYAAQGVRLAAPQIGVPLRVLLASPSVGRGSNGLIVSINPSLLSGGGLQTGRRRGIECAAVQCSGASVRTCRRSWAQRKWN